MHGSYWADVPNNNNECRRTHIAWRTGPWIIEAATILILCSQNLGRFSTLSQRPNDFRVASKDSNVFNYTHQHMHVHIYIYII